ncbi:Zinc finger CCCH domain-containing protein 17 [Acorus calamus]|uniref:Target of rapamycin complex subunit LST8 n=1 Tax=Acorus calamus TaxID=4465 RepID=A0AAV9DDS6_ACOCL|nr:Zinc finger CCCH domain-containing protein 17 [Acorus calamus]
MSQSWGIVATSGYDRKIRFLEVKTGQCYRIIELSDFQVNRLEITPDKQYIAAAGNPQIRLYTVNTKSSQPVTTFDSHTNNVMAVGFQCDGKWMYSGSEDGTVKIWDLRARGCQKEYESPAAVNTVVLHSNQVPEHDTAVRSLTMMWDGSLVVAANNRGTCYIWRVLEGNQALTRFEPLHKLQAHDGYILKCLLSPELCDPHRYLVTASSDHTVKVWNIDGFTLEKTLKVSSDATMRCWSMATGECEREYKQFKAIICCTLDDKAKFASQDDRVVYTPRPMRWNANLQDYVYA